MASNPAERPKMPGFTILFLLLCALPTILLQGLWRMLPDSDWLRWTVAGVGILGAFLLARLFWPQRRPVENLCLSVAAVAAWFMMASYLQDVTNYPFKLSWSEGNRFYDYSLVFGKYLYHGDKPPEMMYNEPGRYALWGILFAIPGLPIWVHRLWNALLFTVALLLLGLILRRWFGNASPGRAVPFFKAFFILWVFLFLIQGPIYPSLLLSAMLVAGSARWKSRVLRLAAVFVAGYYAVLSRWTWLAAPGVWAGLIAFLWEEHDPEQGLAKWLPASKQSLVDAVLLGGVGLLGGILAKPGLLFSTQQATGFALQQPLLLYRLLPNATYGPGILLGTIIAIGPLAILLVWLVISRVWRLSWLQTAAAVLPAMVFLGMGIVASTKIGGGSNLHNLDMFLITLVILSALAARTLIEKGLSLRSIFVHPLPRAVAWTLAALAVLIPVWGGLQSGGPVSLPSQPVVEDALHNLQTQVDQAQAQGEVLFMDHRQLVTFGAIHGVSFVPDYEMKYMMDQSMSGVASRFQQFYEDLRNKRFKLIVIHPLSLQYQGRTNDFGEENDAWVKWVATPLLCYYQPVYTEKEVRLQILAPRKNPGKNCP